jgi:hypothetical protein
MSTSIFVGHAKPPVNSVCGQMYTILSVVCEVEMDTGVIVAAEFTVATDLAKDYLNRLLTGRTWRPTRTPSSPSWSAATSRGRSER